MPSIDRFVPEWYGQKTRGSQTRRSGRFGFALMLVGMFCGAAMGAPPTSVAGQSTPQSQTATGHQETGIQETGRKETVHQDAGMGQPIDSAALAKLSGGSDTSSQITLNGNMSDTRVDHVVTGTNAITSGSFANAVGLPTVIQNSGNGVLIQNATIVDVQFKP